MEVEKALLVEKPIFIEPSIIDNDDWVVSSKSETSNIDLCNHFETFKMLVKMELPCNNNESVEEKLRWLRSQMIGNAAEFYSPFGRRELVYADHTASGRSLQYNEDFIIKHVLPFYGNTHTCDSYVGSRSTRILHEASEYIKECLGGGEENAIIFCGSGTTAAIKRLQEVMGIAVPSILRERVVKSLSKEERWVVFVGPYEHHSNLLSWRQSLAEVVEIGLDDEGLLDMDALKLQLEAYKNTNRPLLGSFSACSNVTGINSDTPAIARLLHQYNAFACFDFAASGPYVEICMRREKSRDDWYDAVFLSPHKFVGGPDTPGILLMNKALYRLNSSPPSICGGGTVNYVNGFDEKDTLYLENIEERENGGTPPIIQTVRAALAFWVKEYIGYKEIEIREQIYINRALKRLISNPNIKVLGNKSTKRQAILSFVIYSTSNSSSTCWGNDQNQENSNEEELNLWEEIGNYKRGKLLHGPFVATLLNDLFGIQARGGCACAGPYGHHLLNINKTQSLDVRSAIQQGYVGIKPGWTRVSFPYYMDEEDFEFILAAIEFVAMYGQRFLPLYSFNLRNGRWRVVKTQELGALIKENNNNNNYCNYRRTMEETSVEYDNGVNNKQVRMLRRKSYLDMAKYIATRLPKFPSQTMLMENVNPSALHFRI
ncbi:hypothetical protein HN51_036939 [Arachis hypogaea]|uniref:uncharacterized protein LOC107634632 n=1 Tax=Arachis ipaensis TaxID=130454 RepID=UPI0007AF7DC0|nr:uncharacterized protein LOC107634632 [Arachis ipaensis]XP_025637764.1 uncharacterized protein LOC112733105 [Arachis hypogaea]